MTASSSTVAALIDATLRRYSGEEAIINEDGSKVTFSQLRERVYRLANGLTAGIGLRKGDALGVLSENRAEYIEIEFACALTGIVKVPLYARNAAAEHVHMLDDSKVVALISEPEFLPSLHQEIGEGWDSLNGRVYALTGPKQEEPGVKSYEDLLAGASAARPDSSHIQPSDIYQVRYTGGTTGPPKGAVHDQAGMLVATWGNLYFHGNEDAVTPKDVIAHILPFSHASIFNIAAHSWAGARHLPMRRWDPEHYISLCEQHGISINLLVPTMINSLLQIEDKVRQRDLSSLTTIAYGAAPIAQSELEHALDLFGPVMTQGYGSTETPSLIVWLPKRDHDPASERIRSCGYAAPWIDVEIKNDGGDVLPRGEVGEVCIKTPSALLEYINLPDATAEALRDGWYHSGDIGLMDEAGYIFLQDRKKDMIISGGFNIYPAEVENAIMSHPDVVECAVVGTPDPKWGQAVSALIRLRPGDKLTVEQVQEHCKQRIGSYKKPVVIKFTEEEMPMSNAGKILRREVREMFAATDTPNTN